MVEMSLETVKFNILKEIQMLTSATEMDEIVTRIEILCQHRNWDFMNYIHNMKDFIGYSPRGAYLVIEDLKRGMSADEATDPLLWQFKDNSAKTRIEALELS